MRRIMPAPPVRGKREMLGGFEGGAPGSAEDQVAVLVQVQHPGRVLRHSRHKILLVIPQIVAVRMVPVEKGVVTFTSNT